MILHLTQDVGNAKGHFYKAFMAISNTQVNREWNNNKTWDFKRYKYSVCEYRVLYFNFFTTVIVALSQ